MKRRSSAPRHALVCSIELRSEIRAGLFFLFSLANSWQWIAFLLFISCSNQRKNQRLQWRKKQITITEKQNPPLRNRSTNPQKQDMTMAQVAVLSLLR